MKRAIYVFLFLIFGFIAFTAWAGGYWENWPLLDRLSGPMRFRQYVASPVPSVIHDLKGGYSGFPKGRVLTQFSFEGDPREFDFLADWVVEDAKSPVGFQGLPSHSYRVRRQKAILIFDESTHQGWLYYR